MPKFPFIRQLDKMDCGPTCLSMIARYYGKFFTLQELRERSQIGRSGVNLLGISEAAESIGFRTEPLKLTYESLLKSAMLPAMLYWDQKHFVVLYKIKKGKFYIADPATGYVVYRADEFRHHWVNENRQGLECGIALLLDPTHNFYRNAEDADNNSGRLTVRNIFRYITPYRKLVFQVFLSLLVVSMMQLILPFLTQSIVDIGINSANMHFVYIVLMAQVSLIAGRLVVEFIRSWILLHISIRINLSILTDFLAKLMKLPIGFFDSKTTGDILQRMNDHGRIESFLTGSTLSTLFSLFNLIIFSVVLAIFNMYMFLVFVIGSILYSCWVMLFMKKRREFDQRRFEISSKEQSVLIQFILGMQEIKLNGVEKFMRFSWESLQARQFRLRMKSLSLNQWQQAGALFINEGKNVLITFLAARAVIDGNMTLGEMLAAQYIIGQLSSPVNSLVGFMQSLQNAKISMERLNEIHTVADEEPEGEMFQQQLPASFMRNLAGGEAADQALPEHPEALYSMLRPAFDFHLPVAGDVLGPDLAGNAIHFRNVSFTYTGAGNEPVLRNIDLTIPQGKTTAIVGTSGSGKTTVLKLLLKFYNPQTGGIYLNETPLSTISHKIWRSHCGAVMQDSFIFSGSIMANIAVGVKNVDMDRLWHAIDMASIRLFINDLPLGLNTKIGQEGSGISMGQKQRILIARAVYRNPSFLFFDEATNSLDANNESTILKNMNTFFKGRTVVVIAHRLSTVKHADQIILLNRGMITERGTHQELVSLKGEYYTLVKNQLELDK